MKSFGRCDRSVIEGHTIGKHLDYVLPRADLLEYLVDENRVRRARVAVLVRNHLPENVDPCGGGKHFTELKGMN